MPFFSVIIPVYNKAFYVEKTLQSVLEQGFRNFEIIIVNDGSTDNSLKIIEDFTDDRIKIFNKTNEGVSVARNYGVAQSAAEYIVFLDADDLWKKNHLSTLKDLIDNFPDCGLYATGYEKKISKNQSIRAQFGNISEGFKGIVQGYFKKSLPFTIAGMGTVALPKTIFRKFQGFSEHVTHGEDIELWTKIAITYNVALHNIPTVFHQVQVSGRTSDIETKHKTFPDFSQFEVEEQQNSDLKRYLDNNRYGIALMFKLSKDADNFKWWQSKIDFKSLNKKQQLLLKLPTGLILMLKKTHQILLQNGLYISTFR